MEENKLQGFPVYSLSLGTTGWTGHSGICEWVGVTGYIPPNGSGFITNSKSGEIDFSESPLEVVTSINFMILRFNELFKKDAIIITKDNKIYEFNNIAEREHSLLNKIKTLNGEIYRLKNEIISKEELVNSLNEAKNAPMKSILKGLFK